jgi:large conductance mechanosensitive channel
MSRPAIASAGAGAKKGVAAMINRDNHSPATAPEERLRGGMAASGDNRMLNEFKKFIARGNVMDMAVGIIMGAAFTAVVNSVVADLINPIIGLVTGGIDFSNKFVNFGEVDYPSLAAAKEAGAPVFAYGSFITALINFLIISFVVFMLIKGVNILKDAAMEEEKKAEEPPKGPTAEELLTDIRDALKARA